MKKYNFLLLAVSFLLLGTLRMTAQEEVLFSSENFKRASKVSKRGFWFQDTTQRKSLFKISYKPFWDNFPGHAFSGSFITPHSESEFGHGVQISFETFLGQSAFAVGFENDTRLFKPNEISYDYVTGDSYGIDFAKYDANRSTVHLFLKYYFNLKRRMRLGASGKNPFNAFFYLDVKDVISVAKTTSIRYTSGISSIAIRRTEETRLLSEPSYFTVGFGWQQRMLDFLIVNLQVGVGTNFHSKFERRYVENVMYDFNLELGIPLLGKSK